MTAKNSSELQTSQMAIAAKPVRSDESVLVAEAVEYANILNDKLAEMGRMGLTVSLEVEDVTSTFGNEDWESKGLSMVVSRVLGSV